MTEAADLFDSPLQIINVGADLFADALATQGVPVTHVTWQPSPGNSDAALSVLARKCGQAEEVRAYAARELGKAFAPERVVFVSALPKTRSAKIVRRAVRAKALGADPGDLSSVENPESLDEIAQAARP